MTSEFVGLQRRIFVVTILDMFAELFLRYNPIHGLEIFSREVLHKNYIKNISKNNITVMQKSYGVFIFTKILTVK